VTRVFRLTCAGYAVERMRLGVGETASPPHKGCRKEGQWVGRSPGEEETWAGPEGRIWTCKISEARGRFLRENQWHS
jgi:hypothetical protein